MSLSSDSTIDLKKMLKQGIGLIMTNSSTREEMFYHCTKHIIMLTDEDKLLLKKKGIECMTHLFWYMSNLEWSDSRFKEDMLMIMNLRYFIMHLFVNHYKSYADPLMKQAEASFCAVDIQVLEYWYDKLLLAIKPYLEAPTPTIKQSTHTTQ